MASSVTGSAVPVMVSVPGVEEGATTTRYSDIGASTVSPFTVRAPTIRVCNEASAARATPSQLPESWTPAATSSVNGSMYPLRQSLMRWTRSAAAGSTVARASATTCLARFPVERFPDGSAGNWTPVAPAVFGVLAVLVDMGLLTVLTMRGFPQVCPCMTGFGDLRW